MINNNRQQQNGRRRGRGGSGGGGGGQRPGGNPGRPEAGNRIDNRARGNAAQLHEKYKTLARDAQMQGDRVNTEYYLQFADHYFRVLAETRSRFEESNNNRQRDEGGFEDEDDFDGEMRADQQRDQQPRDSQRRYEQQGEVRRTAATGNGNGFNDNAPRANDGSNRQEQPSRERAQRDRDDAPEQGVMATEGEVVREPAPRKLRAPRRDATHAVREQPAREESSGLDAALLPPALGIGSIADTDEAEPVAEVKPRRRRARLPASDVAEAS